MNSVFWLVICLLYGGANFYVAVRLYRLLTLLGRHVNVPVFVIVFVLIGASVLLGFAGGSGAFKRIVSAVGSVWMGMLMYLFLFTLAADIVMLVIRLCGGMSDGVRTGAEIAVLILTAAVFAGGVIHSQNIKTVRYEVDTGKNAAPLKIVLISDVHIGALGIEGRLQKMADMINAEEPDLVCIAGDMFNNDFSSVKDPEKAAAALGSIKAKYGVFACLGNHDCGNGFEGMLKLQTDAGIKLLCENRTEIPGVCTLWGRADASPIGYTGDFARTGVDFPDGQELPVIVLDHNPARIDEYGPEVSLVLCGHTHKGQVFPGSLITGSMYRNDYGLLEQENGPDVIVTSGIGYWGPPLRVGSDSEMAVIELR